jgi:hypothetical protein
MDISQSAQSAELASLIHGAIDPRCKIIIFMGQTNADDPDRHRRQTMVPVPCRLPEDAAMCGRLGDCR